MGGEFAPPKVRVADSVHRALMAPQQRPNSSEASEFAPPKARVAASVEPLQSLNRAYIGPKQKINNGLIAGEFAA